MPDGSDFLPFTRQRPASSLPPMIIDSFAGGGGASTGIELALGRSPDVAINHDPAALSMHQANHPATQHLTSNIWQVSPDDVCRGRRVGLAWFSPDCKHHSKAKGGKPVEKGVRDLAWVVVLWAKRARPEVILLENVEEFQEWGPLTPENRPDPDRRGKTFGAWVHELRRLGYKVEWRQMRACDYGAPTIRKRLFVVARRDGRPIVWPTPTHGKPGSPEVLAGTRKPWRAAAEIIDWALPCPSIFDTAEEIMTKHGLRAVRPLKDATLRRIARGVQRYVLDAAQPFIVTCNHQGETFRGQGLTEPFKTVTAARDAHGLVVPALTPFATYAQHGGANRSIKDPLHTVTASRKDQNAIIVPNLISVAHGDSGGRREYPVDEPIGVMSACGTQHALIAPHLMTMRNAGKPFSGADEPCHTITAGGAHLMAVAAFIAQHNGGVIGRGADEPLSTLTTRGTQQQITAAHLMNMHGSQRSARDLAQPHPSICAGGQHGAIIAAFLQKYYGQGTGQEIDAPLHTVATRDTFGLVTVEIAGETYAITDIGMRMLTPREQFRAQGFPESYQIDTGHDGRALTKSDQTRMCGNSVCPPLAEALVRANCAHLMAEKEVAAALDFEKKSGE